MSVEEIQGLARTLTLADYLALSREVLKQGYPDVEYVTVLGGLKGGAPLTLPVIPRPAKFSAACPSHE